MFSKSLIQRRIDSFRGLSANLPLAARLASGYAVDLLALLVLSALVISQFVALQQAAERQARHLQIAGTAEGLARSTTEILTVLDEGLLREEALYMNRRLVPVMDRFEGQYQTLRDLGAVDGNLEESIEQFDRQIEPLLLLFQTSRWGNIRRSRLTSLEGAYPALIGEIQRVAQEAGSAAEEAAGDVTAARQALFRRLAGAALVLLALSAFTVQRSLTHLTRRVNAIAASARKLAAGNMEARATVEINDEIGRMAQAFNETADQFQALYGELETRIEERTQQYLSLTEQMRTSAELAAAATMLLDPVILQDRVVQMISERFGFYHTGIFLLDDAREVAVLQAASSPGGRRMAARGHRLAVGKGVVGFAIEQGRAHVVQQVTEDEVHFQNPDLPETRAEAALPLRARGQVIGALDVQSTSPEAFQPDHVSVLQALADQIALAFDNARLYQQAQERLEEMRRLYDEYSLDAWQDLTRTRSVSGYRYLRDRGVFPLYGEQSASELEPGLFFPIRIRDQEIGKLRLRKPGANADWSEAERSILQALCDQMGLALESARLLEDSQRRAMEERLIGRVTARARESLDIDTVLRTTIEEIGRALEIEEVEVRMGRGGNGHG